MGAEAEPTQIRLVCVGDEEVATGSHVRKWMETRPLEDIEIDVKFDVNLTSALEILEHGDADLIAISALSWYLCKGAPETMVATALPRRDENHILVADDRLNFLPHKTVILANNKLQRRQLRRYRPDLRILKPSAFAELFGHKMPPEGGLALQSWMENLRATKIIGGFVSERHLLDLADMKHVRTFKLTTDPKKDGLNRFLPSPLQGLTLLISRERFPKTMIEKIGDEDAFTAWTCESIILDQIDASLSNCTGIVVRLRDGASLLNKADEEKDLLRSTSLSDNEKYVTSEIIPNKIINVRKYSGASYGGDVCVFTNGEQDDRQVFLTQQEAEEFKSLNEFYNYSKKEGDRVESHVYQCEYDHFQEKGVIRKGKHYHLTSTKDDLVEKSVPSWVKKNWEPMVETIIEAIGKNGKHSVLFEKINLKGDAEIHARLSAKTFDDLFSIATMEHEEDIRLGPARPPFLDL